MARSTAHTYVLMPVLTGKTWFADERWTNAVDGINAQQPRGY